MLHYNLWFNLKPDVHEAEGLSVVRSFLTRLSATKQIAGFRLLRNSTEPPKTILLRYHAQIEFDDSAQFSTAFSDLPTGRYS